ncbi:PGC-1 and ERR-induced regulator in muscle protein 1 isoform X2 [Toxotes jaculatrix]|nr:PGC-1 and ERR-induced regulator in muscle protein 1 isoform X2 [Toxotes jaculatrix]XP_040913346.1 PGC-1 and ERR-induced regulator in muscle protein 1 isoform X2 [Toxotes jaculatrix]
MSDIDERGSLLAKRFQKVDPVAGFSEADRPIDGPPDCEGSPVEHYLSKHGVGGMESVLSGSEEDIHLQSVNMFFERLKNLTEAERPAEPSQVRAGKNREAVLEEEQCSYGQQSSSRTLPKNIPKLNSLSARGETALGKETTRPVDTISNINTMKKVEPPSNISPEPAASNSVLKTNKSAYLETELFIREEACTKTRVNEVTQQNESHDSPDGVVCSGTSPLAEEVMKVETGTPLKDAEHGGLLTSQLTLGDKCNTNSPSNLEMVTNVKWKEEQNPAVLQLDATSMNKSPSQESSPSASIKRKRRKKRRLSFEPAESAHGYERQVLVKPSDSEDEQYAERGGTDLCLSEGVNLFHLNEPQKNVVPSPNLPVRISAKEIKTNDLSHTVPPCDQYQYLPESTVRQGRCKATSSAEYNAAKVWSGIPLSQTDGSVMSAASISGNVVANLQPCTRLQVEEVSTLNKYSWLPVSVTPSLSGKSDKARETADSERKDTHAECLQQTDKMNPFFIGRENEQNLKCCSAEVTSITYSILPSTESNDPAVEVSHDDKLSAAKSVLAVEAGNSGRDTRTLCHREAESQQQLETDCHDADQYNSTLEETHTLNPKPQQFKIRACPFLEEISNKVTCVKLTSDCISSSPDSNLFESLSSLDTNNTEQQTDHPLEVRTLSRLDILSEKNAIAERAHLAASQLMSSSDPCTSGEINLTGSSQRETKPSVSEDLITNPSDVTPLSSCCTLDTESVMSLSGENMTNLSGSFCSSVSQNESGGQGEKNAAILAKHEERDFKSGPKSQSGSNGSTEPKCDLLGEAEDAVTASKAERKPKKEPDSKYSVFAMSSFWSEMEKLTINDILGLRMINKAAPPVSLPPLQESEETGMFVPNDSGFFTQPDEFKPEKTDVYTSSVPDSVESSLASVTAVDTFSSRSVMWESEPVPVSLGTDIYPENMMLTSVSDISQSALSGSPQKSLRKISKNISVHNLHALESESFSSTWKGQTLQILDEGDSERAEYFSDEPLPKQDKDMDSLPSSFTDSYRVSVTDIFQYLFGGKQSVPSQSAADNINTIHADGSSVPETYDDFFSEFDTETFFCPLITAEDQVKDELVPIFSYSRSANRNLQFPEAYDYFFASSSSDDSSAESDEEDNHSPVRVVTRFSRKASSSQICTDVYENFFTDRDLRQNFFWKTTLSFRNINFTGSTVQKQTLSNSLSHVSMRQSGRSLRRTVYPSNALGNQDVMFPDPLLYHLDDRISRQQAQQPFSYEDLQIAVSNPRLDASFLPLRQSDMCLVCIAFASWVLKTANPQVGDAWKAVLLANVSALSAIRYLRKYVKMEAAVSEKKLHHVAPSES